MNAGFPLPMHWPALLAKDFLRAWRNPMPWLLHLLPPLLVVAIMGSVFSPRREEGLGRIRFAWVDEDRTQLTAWARGGLTQGEAAQRLEPVFLERAAAMEALEANQLSAVVIIPPGFTRAFLRGESTQLELVKNPAQSIYPTAMEELLGIATAGLNGLSRNFGPDIARWEAALEGGGDLRTWSALLSQAADRMQTLGPLLQPPLVSYEIRQAAPAAAGSSAGFQLHGYLLAGMTGMFLLFLAQVGMSGLGREVQARTLLRYHTLHRRLLPFVAAKAVFTWLMLMLCAAVLLLGGGWAFGVSWRQPVPLLLLVLAYTLWATALMACLQALSGDQRRGDAFGTVLVMILSMGGGAAFPPEQLPPFVREWLSPWLPTGWFVSALRGSAFSAGREDWGLVSLQLVLLALVLAGLAAGILGRRLNRGERA